MPGYDHRSFHNILTNKLSYNEQIQVFKLSMYGVE